MPNLDVQLGGDETEIFVGDNPIEVEVDNGGTFYLTEDGSNPLFMLKSDYDPNNDGLISAAHITGTTTQFNTALSDGSFATLAGTEELTNKTINGSNNTLTNVPVSSITASAKVRVYNSGNLTASNNSWTSLTFDSEEYDTHAFHSTSSDTSRLTVPAGHDGYYMVVGQATIAGGTNSLRGIRIRKNGADNRTGATFDGNPGTSDWSFQVSTILNLVATDYVEIQVFQNSGGDLTVYGRPSGADSEFNAHLSMVRIA